MHDTHRGTIRDTLRLHPEPATEPKKPARDEPSTAAPVARHDAPRLRLKMPTRRDESRQR